MEARAPLPLRVAFVITGLALGGAEMMLWKLLSRMDRRKFDPHVVVLSDKADALRPQFEQAGIRCHVVGVRGPADAIVGLARLARMLRRLEPDIVQGWMYHGNLAATAGSWLSFGRWPVLWAIRAGLADLACEKCAVAIPIRLSGLLSFTPAKIINNSAISAGEHERTLGYREDKRVILPNGFDVELFKPSTEARTSLRQELALGPETRLVGHISRYHWVKDHETFLEAARQVSGRQADVHYVLVGDDVDSANPHLARGIRDRGLGDRVHLLGRRQDVEKVTAALDIAVCSSITEGFPNVIGEAMSCGVPCVSTDVGDAAGIIADTGRVVPRREPAALAKAIGELLSLEPGERQRLGTRARERVLNNYALDDIVRRYEALYLAVHQDLNAGARR